MNHTGRQKTNIFWVIITALLYIFRESTKSNSPEQSVEMHKPTGHKFVVIESKSDLKNMMEGKWMVLVDYKRRNSHYIALKHFASKVNMAVLYIDTLNKAGLANKYGFTGINKICIFDKNKYLQNVQKELEEEIKKINRVMIKTQRTTYAEHLHKRVLFGRISKYDEKYHIDNIDLYFSCKLRFYAKLARLFLRSNNSSMLIFSLLCSNLVNSLFYILK